MARFMIHRRTIKREILWVIWLFSATRRGLPMQMCQIKGQVRKQVQTFDKCFEKY
jgi:hypothetical protein